MFGFTSFSASDEELERSALSSEHSFMSAETQTDRTTPGKRTRTSDDCEHLRQRRKLSPPASSVEQSTQLACPFAKHDPLRHRRCFKYKMDQISRLKQHLFRVHQVPIHCVRCSQTFGSEIERDMHLRSIPGCAIEPHQTWVGINETQKSQLAQRVSSKKSKEENWYSVYEILFPAEPRPQSPYLDGTQFSEELFALREYAMREAPTLITEHTSSLYQNAKGGPAPPAYKSHVEALALAVVKSSFDTVIDRWLRGGIPAVTSDYATSVTPDHSEAIKETSPPPVTQPQFIDPKCTSTKAESAARQEQQEVGEHAAFDHLLPLLGEGPKTFANVEMPSGLDWLSMVANMDWPWDEGPAVGLETPLQQVLK